MLGSMLAVPSRETVAAFILLAHMGFANGPLRGFVCIDTEEPLRFRIRSMVYDWIGSSYEY